MPVNVSVTTMLNFDGAFNGYIEGDVTSLYKTNVYNTASKPSP